MQILCLFFSYIFCFRTGLTNHTSGYSATGIPIQIIWNRKKESCLDCYKRAVREMFGACTGNAIPKISNVTFASNQGYLIKPLLEFLLQTKAHVVGTLQRASWLPFTFGKPNKDAEGKPQNIELKGAKAGKNSNSKGIHQFQRFGLRGGLQILLQWIWNFCCIVLFFYSQKAPVGCCTCQLKRLQVVF